MRLPSRRITEPAVWKPPLLDIVGVAFFTADKSVRGPGPLLQLPFLLRSQLSTLNSQLFSMTGPPMYGLHRITFLQRI